MTRVFFGEHSISLDSSFFWKILISSPDTFRPDMLLENNHGTNITIHDHFAVFRTLSSLYTIFTVRIFDYLLCLIKSDPWTSYRLVSPLFELGVWSAALATFFYLFSMSLSFFLKMRILGSKTD